MAADQYAHHEDRCAAGLRQDERTGGEIDRRAEQVGAPRERSEHPVSLDGHDLAAPQRQEQLEPVPRRFARRHDAHAGSRPRRVLEARPLRVLRPHDDVDLAAEARQVRQSYLPVPEMQRQDDQPAALGQQVLGSARLFLAPLHPKTQPRGVQPHQVGVPHHELAEVVEQPERQEVRPQARASGDLLHVRRAARLSRGMAAKQISVVTRWMGGRRTRGILGRTP